MAAPASWLGDSLARATGKPVHTGAPSADGQQFGVAAGPAEVPIVMYTGVETISAEFEVRR